MTSLTTSEMSSAQTVAQFLKMYKDEFLLTPTNKVKSVITGHEMSVSIGVINSYFNSKKYKMAKEWHVFGVEKYDYIIPHKSDNARMWCQLTHQPLNKIPDQILRHIQGKKFIRLKNEQQQLKEKSARAKEADRADDVDMEYMQSLANASSDDEEEEDEAEEEEDKAEEDSDAAGGEEECIIVSGGKRARSERKSGQKLSKRGRDDSLGGDSSDSSRSMNKTSTRTKF